MNELNNNSVAIYLIAIALLMIMLLLLPILSVDITTQSNGIIRSQDEDNILQSAIYGAVLDVRIEENTTVCEGDTLLVIDTSKIDEQISYNHLQLSEQQLLLHDLMLLLSQEKPDLISPLFRQELAAFKGKLDEQWVHLSQASKEFKIAEKLYEKKVIPEIDYLEKKRGFEYEKYRYDNITRQQKLNWQTRCTELAIKLKELASTIAQLERDKKQFILTAPISGTITSYSGIKAGNFIVPNQQIARISPDDNLVVECYVSPSDIGLITSNMAVSFQFHSFNYNQWGTGSGKVTEISSNVFVVNQKSCFKVRCSLEQRYLKLKNGYRGYLKKGITLTARFKVTRRTLFQLLYDKTDDWLNPKLQNDEERN